MVGQRVKCSGRGLVNASPNRVAFRNVLDDFFAVLCEKTEKAEIRTMRSDEVVGVLGNESVDLGSGRVFAPSRRYSDLDGNAIRLAEIPCGLKSLAMSHSGLLTSFGDLRRRQCLRLLRFQMDRLFGVRE